jgi:hypothetical protein
LGLPLSKRAFGRTERSFLITRTADISVVRTLISSIKLNRTTLAQRVVFELTILALASGMSLQTRGSSGSPLIAR